jgi:ParB family chromosome partitioning protein
MQLEIHELELKYRELRITDRRRMSTLAASLLEHGQQTPVLVVRGPGGQGYVLIDGYARVAALQSLARDLVEAVVLALGEAEALILGQRLEVVRRRTALEEGWLVRELITGHGMSQAHLAIALGRSVSWVNRRLSLVSVLPASVQAAVQRGVVPAQGATRYLVPLARAKAGDCERLITAMGKDRVSVRQMEQLYKGWKGGDAEQRARVVAHPHLYLKAQEAVASAEITEPEAGLTGDLEGLAAFCRRVRRQVRRGDVRRRGGREREALQSAWREVHLVFDSLTRLMEKELKEDEDARSGYPHSDPAASSAGTWIAGHRQGSADLAQCGAGGSA